MDTDTQSNVTSAGRAAFEWGFRMAEKGIHNLESALAEYDRVMAEPPVPQPATLNTPKHGQS